MLHDPELSLVRAWLDKGGAVQRVPFGVSGDVWCFAMVARQSGAYGAFKRYGGLHIEAAALPHIARGEISAAQARVGFVWALLKLRGPLTIKELATALHFSRDTARPILHEMTKNGTVQVLIGKGAQKLCAVDLPRPPHWTDYLPAQAQAA